MNTNTNYQPYSGDASPALSTDFTFVEMSTLPTYVYYLSDSSDSTSVSGGAIYFSRDAARAARRLANQQTGTHYYIMRVPVNKAMYSKV